MRPDITPLLQQLHSECSDKSWLVTGCQLDCSLASVGLGATRLQRLESTALLNLPFTERFAVTPMLMTANDLVKISNLKKIIGSGSNLSFGINITAEFDLVNE